MTATVSDVIASAQSGCSNSNSLAHLPLPPWLNSEDNVNTSYDVYKQYCFLVLALLEVVLKRL